VVITGFAQYMSKLQQPHSKVQRLVRQCAHFQGKSRENQARLSVEVLSATCLVFIIVRAGSASCFCFRIVAEVSKWYNRMHGAFDTNNKSFREMGEKEGEASNRTVLNIGLWLAVQNSCHVKMNVPIALHCDNLFSEREFLQKQSQHAAWCNTRVSCTFKLSFLFTSRVGDSEKPLFMDKLVICSFMYTVMCLCLPLALGGEMGAGAPYHLSFSKNVETLSHIPQQAMFKMPIETSSPEKETNPHASKRQSICLFLVLVENTLTNPTATHVRVASYEHCLISIYGLVMILWCAPSHADAEVEQRSHLTPSLHVSLLSGKQGDWNIIKTKLPPFQLALELINQHTLFTQMRCILEASLEPAVTPNDHVQRSMPQIKQYKKDKREVKGKFPISKWTWGKHRMPEVK
ncbi:hypothetical protein EK904_010723, partial [Melospiza melodia maxima]